MYTTRFIKKPFTTLFFNEILKRYEHSISGIISFYNVSYLSIIFVYSYKKRYWKFPGIDILVPMTVFTEFIAAVCTSCPLHTSWRNFKISIAVNKDSIIINYDVIQSPVLLGNVILKPIYSFMID